MSKVLKLAKFSKYHSMTDVEVGATWIGSQFYFERFTCLQGFGELLLQAFR